VVFKVAFVLYCHNSTILNVSILQVIVSIKTDSTSKQRVGKMVVIRTVSVRMPPLALTDV